MRGLARLSLRRKENRHSGDSSQRAKYAAAEHFDAGMRSTLPSNSVAPVRRELAFVVVSVHWSARTVASELSACQASTF